MAKRNNEPLHVESFVHVGDKLVNTKDLTPEQKHLVGSIIKKTWLENLYRGEAVFWYPWEPAPDGLVGEQL